MRRAILVLAFTAIVVAGGALPAVAITSCDTVGNATPALASIDCSLTLISGAGTDTLNISIHNTSPFDARVTGFGFDFTIDVAENFTGTQGAVSGNPATPLFTFTNTDQGSVPQFSTVVLDISFLTGASFAGGDPNAGIPPSTTVQFQILGEFQTLTEAQVAEALFVRFQRVGANGEGSDVGDCCTQQVPEPATLILLGGGLVALGIVTRRRLHR